MSCSRTQYSDATETRTRGHSVSSQALYHGATALSLNWDSARDYSTYRIYEQRWFRRVCANAQTRLNLRCSHTYRSKLRPLVVLDTAARVFIRDICAYAITVIPGFRCPPFFFYLIALIFIKTIDVQHVDVNTYRVMETALILK